MVGEEKEKKENYDLMTAVIICLGDSENEHYSGIIKLLDVLLSDEQDPQKKKHILEEDFSVKMTRDLEREVSLMCNLSNRISVNRIFPPFRWIHTDPDRVNLAYLFIVSIC